VSSIAYGFPAWVKEEIELSTRLSRKKIRKELKLIMRTGLYGYLNDLLEKI
jgi:hypothetical protein